MKRFPLTNYILYEEIDDTDNFGGATHDNLWLKVKLCT